jgi:hypothetical protein
VRPASNLSFALDTTASQVFALTATNDNNAAGFTTSLFTGQLTVI